jgi:hypothetical protein
MRTFEGTGATRKSAWGGRGGLSEAMVDGRHETVRVLGLTKARKQWHASRWSGAKSIPLQALALSLEIVSGLDKTKHLGMLRKSVDT